MPDLWETNRAANRDAAAPLAVRMRPRTLEEFAGQQHFLGEGMLLRRMLEADRITSVIFYGPPGTGKTTLAELIARHTQRHFEQANAASVGVKEVRAVLEQARHRLEDDGRRTIFFLDEIHRFTRAQQDVLLGDVERGVITLIGATTENPFFSVNSPLVSRSQIFQFEPLGEDDIAALVRRAIADDERGYGEMDVEITDDAIAHWAVMCDGDARRALSALEIAVLSSMNEARSERAARETPLPSGEGLGEGGASQSRGLGSESARSTKKRASFDSASSSNASAQRQLTAPPPSLPPEGGGAGSADAASRNNASRNNAFPDNTSPANHHRIVIDLPTAEQSIQQKAIVYDGVGDEHYDAASALIKSMRGSDPDAAVYWLAKMLAAGEDPLFVARRIAILASEDIGNADPRAIQVAAAAYEITHRIGMPECQLTLAQAAIYMATAPKSNASATAIWTAMKDVKEGRTVPVPRHLRDGHYAGAKKLGNAAGYQYAHKSETGFVDQDYLGVDKTYYTPTERGYEKRIGEFLKWIEGQRGDGDAET